MATVKEIAQLSGVSRGTVDRVIHNRGGVGKEICARVMWAIEQLNYSPNKAARSLSARKRNYLFTFILFDPHRASFFSSLLDGIQKAAKQLQESGVTVKTRFVSSWEPANFLEELDAAMADGTNGIAIACHNLEPIAQKLRSITAQGIPVVTVNSEITNCGELAYVGSDSFRSGQAVAKLIDLTQREPVHLGVVLGFRSSRCHMNRFSGLRDGLDSLGRPWDMSFLICNNDDEFDSFDMVKQQMQQHPEVNTLVLATGTGAFGACRALESLRLPKNPLVFGFDGTYEIREMLRRGIITASICQQPHRQGSVPLEILFDYLALGIRPESPVIYTRSEILIRELL